MAKQTSKQSTVKVSGLQMKNIKEQKKEEASKAPQKKKEKRNDPVKGLMAQYAKQFLLPIEVEHPMVCPSSYPTQVCSRHIHRVFDISSATPAFANGFRVMMNPDLENPGSISSSVPLAFPSVPGIASCSFYAETNNLATGDLERARVDIEGVDGVKHHTVLQSLTDSVGTTMSGITITPSTITAVATTKVIDGAAGRMEYYGRVPAGAWTILGLTGEVGYRQRVQSSYNGAVVFDAIGFRFTRATVVSEVNVKLIFSNEQITAPSDLSFSPAFERFILDNKVTTGRVVSMSILATNTSPEIANGGNINIGRVPRNFNPVENIPSQMAALPSNRRYQGPAARGGYASWMPAQFDEFEVDNIAEKSSQLESAEFLICEVTGWNPPVGSTASFRLQFDWIVEFYTPNQLFEKIVTPPSTPEFVQLYHALLAMDAATCNPGHLDQLKQLVASGIGAFQSGMKFYGEHQRTIDGVLSLLVSLL